MQSLDTRLGRAIAFVHQHDPLIQTGYLRAEIEVVLLAGSGMDFASRLRAEGSRTFLTPDIARQFAKHAGLGTLQMQSILPALKAAQIIDYTVDQDGRIASIQEFVGVSAKLIDQATLLLRRLSPTSADEAFLHSVDVASLAPLWKEQHLELVVQRGFSPEEAEKALTLTLATGVNQSLQGASKNDLVVFSPYVWGSRQIDIATFLRGLPANERDVLLGVSQKVLATPGLAVGRLGVETGALRSAQRIGLVQTATVRSNTGASSTYAFSPLLEVEDDLVSTTEALHQRKLFVAHILFGHEQARMTGGRVGDPVRLVDALIRRGSVGPASNISTDYHMLEAAGIVRVEAAAGSDRAYLRLVQPEIAESGLTWLRKITERSEFQSVNLTQAPGGFENPEAARRAIVSQGAFGEVERSAILELRKAMQSATRAEDPWS